MKITIDTKEDNHEDIKKVIALLNGMIGNNSASVYSNQPISAPADSTNLMSMFGDDSASAAKTTPDTAPNFGSFLNLVDGKKKEEVKGMPKIEMY